MKPISLDNLARTVRRVLDQAAWTDSGYICLDKHFPVWFIAKLIN